MRFHIQIMRGLEPRKQLAQPARRLRSKVAHWRSPSFSMTTTKRIGMQCQISTKPRSLLYPDIKPEPGGEQLHNKLRKAPADSRRVFLRPGTTWVPLEIKLGPATSRRHVWIGAPQIRKEGDTWQVQSDLRIRSFRWRASPRDLVRCDQQFSLVDDYSELHGLFAVAARCASCIFSFTDNFREVRSWIATL